MQAAGIKKRINCIILQRSTILVKEEGHHPQHQIQILLMRTTVNIIMVKIATYKCIYLRNLYNILTIYQSYDIPIFIYHQ